MTVEACGLWKGGERFGFSARSWREVRGRAWRHGPPPGQQPSAWRSGAVSVGAAVCAAALGSLSQVAAPGEMDATGVWKKTCQ